MNDPTDLTDPFGLDPCDPLADGSLYSYNNASGQQIGAAVVTVCAGSLHLGRASDSTIGQRLIYMGGRKGGGGGGIVPKVGQFLGCAAGAGLILNSLTESGTNTTSAGGTVGFTYGSGLSRRDWNYNVSLNGDTWGNVSLTQTTGHNPQGNPGAPGTGGPGAMGFGYTAGITVANSKGTVGHLNGPGRSMTAAVGPASITGSEPSRGGPVTLSATYGTGFGGRFSGG